MTDATIVGAVRTFIATYEPLKTGALIVVDSLGVTPTTVEYVIAPQPGDRILTTYLDDSTEREFPFAFQSVESTADDLARIENSGFYEAFAEWLDAQTAAGNLPTLPSGKSATAIRATSWAYLYQEGESMTGMYQIICKLVYDQEAP